MPSKLYDRNFALAFASNALFVMANTLSMVHFARWVVFLGGDRVDIGWILGFGAVAAVLCRPWIGRWIDRLGPRSTWTAGGVVFVATALAFLVLRDIGLGIYALRIVAMLAPALVFTSNLAYLSHTTPPPRLAEAIGSMGAAGLVGIAIGPALGDVFLGAPDTRSRADFVALFGTAAGVVVASVALLSFLRPAPPHPDARRTAFLPSVWRYWPGCVLLVVFAFGMNMAVVFGFLAEFVDDRGIGHLWSFYMIYAVWAIVLRVTLRTLPQRIGRGRQAVIGMAFMTLAMLCYPLVDRPLMLVLPALAGGTAHALTFPPMVTLVMQAFPPALRGTGSAVALMTLDAGMVVGGPVIGFLAHTFDYGWTFLCLAGFCAIVTVIFAVADTRRRAEKSASVQAAATQPASAAGR